jgi:hypothetical protein
MIQHSPWVLFTFWHLGSLVAPFRAYDAITRPLSELRSQVPPHSRILPVFGSESLNDPGRYSFGGIAGFAFMHTGKWLVVETQGYQPWSFCDEGYHPMRCTSRLPASNPRSPLRLRAGIVDRYQYLLVLENAADVASKLSWLPVTLVSRAGQWSLWRVN